MGGDHAGTAAQTPQDGQQLPHVIAPITILLRTPHPTLQRVTQIKPYVTTSDGATILMTEEDVSCFILPLLNSEWLQPTTQSCQRVEAGCCSDGPSRRVRRVRLFHALLTLLWHLLLHGAALVWDPATGNGSIAVRVINCYFKRNPPQNMVLLTMRMVVRCPTSRRVGTASVVWLQQQQQHHAGAVIVGWAGRHSHAARAILPAALPGV